MTDFGVLLLWNKVSGHWPPKVLVWPYKLAKTSVFRFSWVVTYSEYLSWHVANTVSSSSYRSPPPVLGHLPLLVCFSLDDTRAEVVYRVHLDEYFVNQARTERFKNSSIPFLQRKLNESAKQERKQLEALLQVNCVSHVDPITFRK